MNRITKRKFRSFFTAKTKALLSAAFIFLVSASVGYAQTIRNLTIHGSASIANAKSCEDNSITASIQLQYSWFDSSSNETVYAYAITFLNNGDSEVEWYGQIKGTPDMSVESGEVAYANANGVADITPYAWATIIYPNNTVTSYPIIRTAADPFEIKWIKVNQCLVYGEETDEPDTPVEGDIAISSIVLKPSHLSMTTGETASIIPTTRPGNATEGILWNSSDPSIASVDAGGNVTALSAGNVTIIATSESGSVSAECSISIHDPLSFDDVEVTFTRTGGWANHIQFRIDVKNKALIELSNVKIELDIPYESSYILWSQNFSGNKNTMSFNSLPPSSTTSFYGQIDFPEDVASDDYPNVNFTILEVK